MLVPILLVLALTQLASTRARTAAAAASALMVGTIFLSGSRGGMLAIIAELVILAILLVKQKQSAHRCPGWRVSHDCGWIHRGSAVTQS